MSGWALEHDQPNWVDEIAERIRKVPFGYCQCGCGERTPLARKTDRRFGHVKGEPLPYLRAHSIRAATKARAKDLRGLTHCKRGHPLSGDNLSVRENGKRNCRACASGRNKRSTRA